jgi:hypothetical protein
MPVHLNGNSWWVFEGFNVKSGATSTDCGPGATVSVTGGSNDNAFRRIVAWDTCAGSNSMVVSVQGGSSRNVFEDFAAFGTGRKIFQAHGGSNDTICRRCWFRWDGGLTGGSVSATTHYNSTGSIFENSLFTWSGEVMPESYTTPAAPVGSGQGTMYNSEPAGSLGVLASDRLESASAPKFANSTLRGSIVYVKPGAHLPTRSSGGGPGTFPMIFFYGASGYTLTDVVSVLSPSHSQFDVHHGIVFQRTPHNGPTSDPHNPSIPVVENSATRLTSIRGAKGDTFHSDWSVSGVSAGTSLDVVQSPWQNTSTTGARVCFRWGTTEPLWPWPMNERIKAATAMASSYNGLCPTCVGGRAVRSATDVTADIEKLLGTIATACRR